MKKKSLGNFPSQNKVKSGVKISYVYKEEWKASSVLYQIQLKNRKPKASGSKPLENLYSLQLGANALMLTSILKVKGEPVESRRGLMEEKKKGLVPWWSDKALDSYVCWVIDGIWT